MLLSAINSIETILWGCLQLLLLAHFVQPVPPSRLLRGLLLRRMLR